jgi:nicotinate-nucleotide adenylyltransferase
MEDMHRLGVLGGSFNPVHMGHLLIAQSAFEALDLERVLFVPCATPAHKQKSGLADSEDRLAMLEAVLEHDPRFDVCDIEIRRGGTSYTVDTMKQLREMHPQSRFFFIIGLDTLPELHTWKSINELLGLCEFVTFVRPGHDLRSLKEEDLKLMEPWPRRLLDGMYTGIRVDISSSDIRHRVAEGMSIRYLVPMEVEIYISEHSLYQQR